MGLALFGWTLFVLALLDLRYLWLPDRIVLPLIVAGLMASVSGPLSLPERLTGAIAGYVVLECMRRLYRAVRRHDGIGGGDPKLFAALGAWLGVSSLPWVLLLGAFLVLAGVVTRALRGPAIERKARLPLGTGLSLAAILLMPIFACG